MPKVSLRESVTFYKMGVWGTVTAVRHNVHSRTVLDYEVILIFKKVLATALGLCRLLIFAVGLCLIASAPSAETSFPKYIMDDCFAIASIYTLCLCLPFI